MCVFVYYIYIYIYIYIYNIVKENFAIGNSVVRSEVLPTKATITDEGRLVGTFCSKTVFNLIQRALSGIVIQVF